MASAIICDECGAANRSHLAQGPNGHEHNTRVVLPLPGPHLGWMFVADLCDACALRAESALRVALPSVMTPKDFRQ